MAFFILLVKCTPTEAAGALALMEAQTGYIQGQLFLGTMNEKEIKMIQFILGFCIGLGLWGLTLMILIILN